MQDIEIRDALQHFTVMGPLGSLLDADHDMLGDGRFLSFETENLLQLDDKAVIPVLLYLFRRIEQRLDGSPTLVLLDEAWSYSAARTLPQSPEGLAEDDAAKERRGRDGHAADQRHREFGDRRRRSGKLPDQDSAAECGVEESRLARVLSNASVSTSGNWTSCRSASRSSIITWSARSAGVSSISASARLRSSWVGVNGREERQIVESVMDQFPDTWRAEWLRLKGLPKWAEYLCALEGQKGRSIRMRKCVIALRRYSALRWTAATRRSRCVRDRGDPVVQSRPARPAVHPAGTAARQRAEDVCRHAPEHVGRWESDVRRDRG